MFLSAGKCPIPQIRPECPDTPSSLCSIDVECPGNQKCCDDGCLGLQCEDPCKWGGHTHALGLAKNIPWFRFPDRHLFFLPLVIRASRI